MGRRKWSRRLRVEDCLPLDIGPISRLGALRERLDTPCTYQWLDSSGEVLGEIGYRGTRVYAGGLAVELQYSVGPPDSPRLVPMNYIIEVTSTPRNFGGVQHWFCCPAALGNISCLRRVRVLHLPPGQRAFLCRGCHDLTYRSCQEHDKRLDVLVKGPPELLIHLLKSANVSERLLGVRASTEILRRFKRQLTSRVS
jgi:hypothetical protein